MKRSALLFLQFTVTTAGLYFVFRDPQQRAQIGSALQKSDWQWLALGWICYSLVEGLATVRWQILLRVQDIHLDWLRAGAMVVLGLFFNMFLPGLIGGDASLFCFQGSTAQKNARYALGRDGSINRSYFHPSPRARGGGSALWLAQSIPANGPHHPSRFELAGRFVTLCHDSVYRELGSIC